MMNRRPKRTEAAATTERAVPPAESPGTAVYGDFLKDELAAQDARKASFEQRGLAVVTTAGTLVTLLFGLTALLPTAGASHALPGDAKKWLAVALVVFVVAAGFALVTNFPFFYDAPKADAIKTRLNEDPVRAEAAARRDIALTRTNMLRDAKKKNGWKGWLLFAAMSLEVVAVAFVGVAIFEVINP